MNTKKSKKINAKSPNAENKKKKVSKPRKPVEPSSENDEVLNDSSESDWEPMSSDSEDEYTEEDMEDYLRAFYKQMWVSGNDPGPARPDQFYQYFCKQHFEDTRQYLKKKKKASTGKKNTTKKVTAKGKKKKVSKNEEKVQTALLKLMPKLYKTQLKVMTRRILKAKPINYGLLHVLSDILKDKHLEVKLTGKPKYRDLETEQLQILHLLEGCAKGYNRTHVAHDLAKEYLRKVGYQRDKQKQLERQALKAAGGGKKGK